MDRDSQREVRMQYMFPYQLHEELTCLPLIFLPLATLEWHGPHLAVGMDPISAEQVAVALAKRIGGVVFPTLYMGTERERSAEVLESLGFGNDEYIIGMDFPDAEGMFKSFYFSEELFALAVRGHIELFIEHGYKYVYIVNGHGAVNHNEVLRRLCIEFSNKVRGISVDFSVTFPKDLVAVGAIGHADKEETSLMMYYNQDLVDLDRLPPKRDKLRYKDYSVVDGGGFIGDPGEDHAVPHEMDPRHMSSVERGRKLFEKTLDELEEHIRQKL